ncbi:methionine ABC transporter ATP-binding protein [Klebsiella sp. BIGb0407]|uniref:methionine ABC transporter ATP-binding protein n=1 Tax=Klebsiella sp. BIGb0407 TaxID=2940603 RepID=UPI002167C3B5|nr:methionine ABC transporter ATP-binding protein [Klebsiella sp. BIGb0407]MCS3434355.1 D-methionine transport system ATP-binding protein [Klebsiella sp. BIGb0407]
MITLKNVSKIYQRNKKQTIAVDNINLNISAGDIFGIIGYSGAGKSSLIRLLNKLENTTSGEVIVGEHNITHSDEKSILKIRQSIGMIFQHFNLLWSKTVRENIEFPLQISGFNKKERQQRVVELMELVGLTDKADEYPSMLSGGQKQRVGIARALANNPDVLLCDEATSALDPKTTQNILELLARINRELNITIVLITHEMQVVKSICNKVAVIDKGKIVEEGLVTSVFHHPQHAITRQFLAQSNIDSASLDDLQELLALGPILRIILDNESLSGYLFYDLITKFNQPIRLVKGAFSQGNGFIYLQFPENQTLLVEAIDYLTNEKNVVVEVV